MGTSPIRKGPMSKSKTFNLYNLGVISYSLQAEYRTRENMESTKFWRVRKFQAFPLREERKCLLYLCPEKALIFSFEYYSDIYAITEDLLEILNDYRRKTFHHV